MSVRDSKAALREAARLLRTDTQTARAFLRAAQHAAGPIPYAVIVEVMKTVPELTAESVIARLVADHPPPADD
jgi:hypothetical protein